MPSRKLSQSWQDLLLLFRKANTLSQSQLVSEIETLKIDSQIRSVLSEAVNGDNRAMNSWLFSHDPEDRGPLAWIAPVLGEKGSKRYAWMIGFQSLLAPYIRMKFEIADARAQLDPLLMQTLCPPPLLFVNPLEVSQRSVNEIGEIDYDEFAIFQTNYKANQAEVPDIEQHMVLNTTYVTGYRKKAFRRTLALTEFEDCDLLEQNSSLISLIHTEGHNRGHFLGPWPLNKEKKCVLYEALEEFRACIAAIRLAEHMGLGEKTLDMIATSVFLTRFLGYGFDAYCLSEQRRRTIREITVGLMFFEDLRRKGAIEVRMDSDSVLRIHPSLIRKALMHSLHEIHYAEGVAKRNIDSLRNVARHWYGVAFPNCDYSREAVAVYDHLSRKERVGAT